ncbi:MAG: DUF4177 domain-containing protein [Cytophagia bacterium]|nr:MAG: DUF4177 domain-containing protein [Runella slithyformis]TAG17920.1 MAG: DUF4177 domain-containing protein [Cytophagales bacterium]TAG37431.1 MAG: DUF4177 domain-containing protein [Cytophagia bacterium]TAG75364.1 MAG: DUF4177 domain-containing protein [Runella slithyformis]TAG78488.1 MAG: DUF4177 domain-containing protein [Cytophagales bacterium]
MQYEYTVRKIDLNTGLFSDKERIDIQFLDNELAELGKEGWELIDSTTVTNLGTTMQVVYVFKRVRQ